MRACEITTDAGSAFVKCLGNPEGPHALACEWLGTRVAELMGIPTLDFAVLTLTDEDTPFTGGREEPGPAFATRAEDGFPWAGDEATLQNLSNPEDVPKLVVLDTYLRNWDRHSPNGTRLNKDNVFLSQARAPEGQFCLLAMDHSHAISHGRAIGRDLEHIGVIKDERIYGLFDAFLPFLTKKATRAAVDAVGNITTAQINDLVAELPRAWEVDATAAQFLRTFLTGRRAYLRETFYERLAQAAGLS